MLDSGRIVRSMNLYTWKDVERKLLLNKDKWGKIILNAEIYTEEMIIYILSEEFRNTAQKILNDIFEEKYDSKSNKIRLDLSDRYLNVFYEVEENTQAEAIAIPLFKKVLYQQSAYYDELVKEELPGAPVIAFHSYKGGVGRTLSLLAFVKAWSTVKPLNNPKKLLIVDADIEAPGITWLAADQGEAVFSFLDLLEITQEKDCVEEIIELVVDKVSELSIKIETEKSIVEHIVLPTYRYIEQLLDMYSSPESLALSYNKKYILAEVLSKLGEKVNTEYVLVDLRAGLSEFSAPLLFDPRVKKFLVTSTSYQSVKGTEILLNQLGKGLSFSGESQIPEIFLTMVRENINTADIISDLVTVYDRFVADENISIIDDIVTELPFASELVHLESLQKIMKSLSGRDFYNNILELVQNSYSVQNNLLDKGEALTRTEIVHRIHDSASYQITAEGNGALKMLMTESIQNLIKKYKSVVPNTVIMGAKGSGKTFLYREILRNQFWDRFVLGMNGINHEAQNEDMSVFAVPLLASGNVGGFHEILDNAIQNFNKYNLKGKLKSSVYLDNRDSLLRYARNEYDQLAWNSIWEKIILNSLNSKYQTLEELQIDLDRNGRKIVFLVDGLEEIFSQTITSQTEKNAIVALCRDLINDIKIRYRNIGMMVFLRKDMVRDSITVNFEQFNSLYNSVELQWTSTEALRLVVWMVSQAVPEFYQEEVAIELAPRELIDRSLHKLWGIKLGKPSSNEANSSRWILAALSDFNGQLQARDIIRFLEKSTVSVGKTIYDDRYLMPTEIKNAVSGCSYDKISEVRQEIKALGPIFDRLENAPAEKKILPFYNDTFNLSQAEEKIMKQEGYLRIENDKYYLPEIIRHALKFKYEKGARPKVLSLLLKREI